MRNNLIFNPFEQGTDEWLEARIAMLTGSECSVLDTYIESKKSFGKGAITLATKLATERLTLRSQDGTLYLDKNENNFVRKTPDTGAMLWGKLHENDSMQLFNEQYAFNYQKIGFIHIEGTYAGCSLDGVDYDYNSILEMKHYDSVKVIDFMLNPQHFWDHDGMQAIHNAWVFGASRVDLICRDPRLPSPLDKNFVLITKQGEELQELIHQYEIKANLFLKLVDDIYNKCESISLKILGLD